MFCCRSRQTQAQPGDSTSKTVSVSLLDILRQVPTLPESLSPGCQKALSATCKSCRLQFIAQVQVVTLLHEEDYVWAVGRRWPQLRMVISKEDAYYTTSLPSHIRIFKVSVSAEGNDKAAISLLRPLNHLATDLPCTHLAAQQLAHQMRVRWPLMQFFAVSSYMPPVPELHGLGLAIVSQLVQGTWTRLKSLYLDKCELNTEAFLLLSQGNWPDLRTLNVSGNCLDAEGMALLAKGNWPLLSGINLSFNSTLDAMAIAHLSAVNWPLGGLTISDTPFSIDVAVKLADLQLPNLTSLALRGSGLTAAAVSELAKANWPNLGKLSIEHDDLDALAALFGVNLDKVQEVKSSPRLFARVVEHRMVSWPDVGLWPNLSWITITKRNLHLGR